MTLNFDKQDLSLVLDSLRNTIVNVDQSLQTQLDRIKEYDERLACNDIVGDIDNMIQTIEQSRRESIRLQELKTKYESIYQRFESSC